MMIILFLILSLFEAHSEIVSSNCGPTVLTSWKYTEKSISLDKVKEFEDIQCLGVGNLPGANVKLELLDSKGEVLLSVMERFNFNPISHKEITDSVPLSNWSDFKIIKLPKLKSVYKAERFRIQALNQEGIKLEGKFEL